MRVYDVVKDEVANMDKQYGRTLTKDNFHECLEKFFNNGRGIRWNLLDEFQRRIDELFEVISKLEGYRCVCGWSVYALQIARNTHARPFPSWPLPFHARTHMLRFYSSSLLVVYSGDAENNNLEVRMIDFARTVVPGSGPFQHP
jgi:hypothetical protein